jgi:hypothetical protein
MDPKRPALAEHPGNKQGSSSRNSAGGEQFTNPGGYQGMPPVGFSGSKNYIKKVIIFNMGKY